MSHIIINVIILLMLILMTSLFVGAEIAIISSRKSSLNALAKKNKGAKKALELASNPEDFLATVQVGITFINVLIGIYGGTHIAETLSAALINMPYITEYVEEISYSVVVVSITFLTVLGEVIPKRIGMLHPEKVASATAYVMFVFTKIFYPFVKMLAFLTILFLKALKIKESPNNLTMEELRLMLNQAELSGMLAATEHDILKRILHLSNTQVGAIMTPRNKMVCLDMKHSDKENIEKIKKHAYHHFPVVDNGLQNLIGIAPSKALLNKTLVNEKILREGKKLELIYVPETARVSKLIDVFREKKVTIALVIDEYGDIEGLVTLNDVFKILVGDLAIGVSPAHKPSVVVKAANSYEMNGNTLIEEVMSTLNVSSLPGDEDEDYRTLAGFILSRMQKFPKNGDHIECLGWSFTIIKMEKRRIERVKIKKSA